MSFFGILYISLRSVVRTLCVCEVRAGIYCSVYVLWPRWVAMWLSN